MQLHDAASGDPATLHVVGAGDHALVTIDAFRGDHVIRWIVIDPSDAADELSESDMLSRIPEPGLRLVNGIGFTGGINRRHDAFERFRAAGYHFERVVHPTAIISERASLREGVHALARSSIGPDASVGDDSIINTGAIIEHHVAVGAGSHIGPGVTICGRALVGDGVFIGAGAVVLPGVNIGAGAIVGAGSTVVADVPDHATVYGSPARPRSL